MKSFFTFLFVLSLINVDAQITLVDKYPGDLESSKFTRYGLKMVNFDKVNEVIRIYNTDNTIFKTINVPSISGTLLNVYYVSDSLFNTDAKIEYIIDLDDGVNYISKVINEDGEVLLTSLGQVTDIPAIDFIIDESTKIIFESSDTSYVYQLPGKYEPVNPTDNESNQTLAFTDGELTISDGNTVDISSVNTDAQKLTLQNDTLYLSNGGSVYIGETKTSNQVINLNADGLSNVYPNPTNDFLQVCYQFPINEDNGTILLINNRGVIENEYKVFENNGIIKLDLSSYVSGQYYIKLQTANGYSSIKKALVIK